MDYDLIWKIIFGGYIGWSAVSIHFIRKMAKMDRDHNEEMHELLNQRIDLIRWRPS